MALRPGYLPVPLVIGVLPFASLLVAGVADTAWGRTSRPAGTAYSGGRTPDPLALSRILTAGCLAAAVVIFGPQWWQRDHDRPFRQAEAWIAANVPHTARLLIDDALWVDLVERGYRPGQLIWFYKLDTDRDIQGRYPQGWREFDYLVSPPRCAASPITSPSPRSTASLQGRGHLWPRQPTRRDPEN